MATQPSNAASKANAAAVLARMDVLRRRLELCERLVTHLAHFDADSAGRELRALELVTRRDALLQEHGRGLRKEGENGSGAAEAPTT